MRQRPIPFNRSSIVGKECSYVAEVMAGGRLAGDQAFGRKCEALLREELGVPAVLLTTSGTHALEMSAFLLEIGEGDEVIVPSYAFSSTANAYAIRGARIVFADVRPDSLNIDPADIERRIGPRTRAVVLVNYAGVACDMEDILRIADARGVAVVEDNAHGLFGAWHGRPLGTFGTLGIQSFHETKNFTCGEGGALVIRDERHIERAMVIRDKGTDRGSFLKDEVERYTWVDQGSSYLMSDLLAAYLYGQLEQRPRVQESRRRIWEAYDRGLRGWAEEMGIGVPTVPAGASQGYHMYYLLLRSPGERQELARHLGNQGIGAVSHYQALHLSEMGRRHGGKRGDCPVTESVVDRILRLPFYFSLGESDQERVIREIGSFIRGR